MYVQYVHVHFAAEPLPNPVVISLVFVCSYPNQQFYVLFSSNYYCLTLRIVVWQNFFFKKVAAKILCLWDWQKFDHNYRWRTANGPVLKTPLKVLSSEN
jgi:hypothetical protein